MAQQLSKPAKSPKARLVFLSKLQRVVELCNLAGNYEKAAVLWPLPTLTASEGDRNDWDNSSTLGR